MFQQSVQSSLNFFFTRFGFASWKSVGKSADASAANFLSSASSFFVAKRSRSNADATRSGVSPSALGDAATRLAIERSLADVEASRENLAAGSFPSERVAKRRKLISVDCSSEYRADEALADGAAGSGGGVGQSQSLQYRFGFQLGLEQLDSRAELRKTFPVPGGRPAFWGSHGRIVPSPRADVPASSAREKVSGRRPFARDARATYVDDAGVAFDSGDEWDEPEDGERLDGSDEAVDFDPADLMPAPFPGEEFDARLEERFAQLSAKVG